MLSAAAARGSWLRPLSRVCADAARLPLADASVDLISAISAALSDADRLLAEFRACWRRAGADISTLGPDTLRELRGAWASVDSNPRCMLHRHARSRRCPGEIRFAEPVLDVERYTLEYPDVRPRGGLEGPGRGSALAGRSRDIPAAKIRRHAVGLRGPSPEWTLPATYE